MEQNSKPACGDSHRGGLTIGGLQTQTHDFWKSILRYPSPGCCFSDLAILPLITRDTRRLRNVVQEQYFRA